MKLPSEWEMKTLGELGTCHIGLTYKPDNVVPEGGTLVLRSSNIQQSRLVFDDNVFVNMDVPSKLKVCYGDILICVRNGSRSLIGKSAVIEREHAIENLTFGAFMSVYRTDHHDYVRHLFHSDMYYRQIRNNLGATINQITNKNLNNFTFPFPKSSAERNKISEVLSTVDKKIDLIDQKIAETEKLKTGLMQKLFSEGVGVQEENGDWQPHSEFQDSPFGKIPQPWSTLELAEIADIEDGDRGKSYPKQADFSDFGYCLFLSAKNVTKQGFTYETTQFISQEKHNKLRKGQVLQNDIVLTTRGTVGNFGLFKHEELFDAVRINSGMAIIRCIDSSMPNYLYQFMQSPQFKAQISKVVFGSAQPQLTIKQIKKFKVLVPTSEEKKWIEETLKLANDKLTLLEQQKAETQQLKKGLMQKLLTGEWRVPVEETEAA
ncbi:TPA: restriction endonuclease subunit S [Vibrio diabolicus]